MCILFESAKRKSKIETIDMYFSSLVDSNLNLNFVKAI